MHVRIPAPAGPSEQPDDEYCDLCTSPVPWQWLSHHTLPAGRWIRPCKHDDGRLLCDRCVEASEREAREARVMARLKKWGVPSKYRGYRWGRIIKQQVRRNVQGHLVPAEPFPMFKARIEDQPKPTIGITNKNVDVAKALRDWRPVKDGRWILVSGITGTGKTTFACATIAELAAQEPRHERLTLDEMYAIDPVQARRCDPEVKGYTYALPVRIIGGYVVQFAPEHDLQQASRGWYKRSRAGARGETDPVELLYNVPCLFLDDLGTAEQNDRWKAKISGLLNHRYSNGLPTVITSNESRATIEIMYGSRLGSRLHEIADYHELELQDWRRVRAAS